MVDDDYDESNDYSAYGDAGWQPDWFDNFLADQGKDIKHVSSFETWHAERYGRYLLESFVDYAGSENGDDENIFLEDEHDYLDHVLHEIESYGADFGASGWTNHNDG